MTKAVRLQPVQAWAIVDQQGQIVWETGLYRTEKQARWYARFAGPDDHIHVVRVTVRAWAPPTQKKVKR